MSDFSTITHLADGSNANVYVAELAGKKVILKKIKEAVKDDSVAKHEFETEHGLLARVQHPNILALYGAGVDIDRKFLVLQHLGGGTLKERFEKKPSSNMLGIFGNKKTFTFAESMARARELATALNYLHNECVKNACIIHRDLKPDNIAFTDDCRLVLFDLGLCTIVRRGSSADTVYEMTGGTGSLRYMAPEVALEQPYNEKADLYSFAIILWQMAADQLPYEGASRASYLRYACKYGDRPDLNPRWPQGFKDLLTQCWHQEFRNRPSFDHVIEILDQLLGSIKP